MNKRNSRELESLKVVTKLIKQQLGVVEVRESSDMYAHYDLISWWKNNPIYFEVKERWCDYNTFIQYANEGFILEDIKYNFLKGKANRYINKFTLNGFTVIITWDINKIFNDSVVKDCQATTEFINSNMVSKQVKLVTPSQGTIYVYSNGKFNEVSFKELIDKINK